MKQEIPIITMKGYKKEKKKKPLCSLAESMEFYYMKYRIKVKINEDLNFHES